MKEIIDIIHKSVYPFFDVCKEGEEPLSEKDKLLLKVNKAICNNLKALEQEAYENIPPTAIPVTVEEAKRLLHTEWKKEVAKDNSNNRLLVAYKMAVEALLTEPCDDVISRKSIKQKLQEHHDFFVNAYGGFSNLPQNDKSRVDEIINCIAIVVNEPPVKPQQKIGHWVKKPLKYGSTFCSECGHELITIYENFCPHCGADMRGEE